jgi:ankyrin repeat protein
MLARLSLVLAISGVAGLAAGPRNNPLVDAVRSGDKQAVALLLKDKTIDVNAALPDGTTALHWAVDRDDREITGLLIKAGAKVRAANRYGVMPLSLAAERGDAVVVSLLLDAGAGANTSMPGGETALMTAARTGKTDAMKALLVHGAKVDARDDTLGETALMWAAGRDNVDAVSLLIEFGADRNARTKNTPRVSGGGAAGLNRLRNEPTSFSAFLFAVRGGHIGAARALLDAGADANDKLSDGETALVLACANGHWEMASMLLDRGADPNSAEVGWNALHQLVRERRPNFGFGVPGPIETGTMDSIELLRKMIAKNANVNARMSKDGMKDGQRNRLNRLGATPFLLAAKNTDVEAMKILLAAGADPLIPTADNVTPLMAAAGVMIWNPGEDGGSLQTQEAEQLEAVRICLERGNDINAADIFGDTPLHGAAYRGANSILEFLIQAGAKLDAKDVRGWTPLTVANGVQYDCFYKVQTETADLLRKYMKAAGLSTEGQVSDGTECLDCFSTHPAQAKAYLDRVNRQESEWTAGAQLPAAGH